jgi:hypothetical protein
VEGALSDLSAEVRDNAVNALRHWVGREPGQDLLLFKMLVEKKKYNRLDASTFVQLLHSFSPDDLDSIGTYEALIDNLANERLPIRELAHWHLLRLVPEGKVAAYDPVGSEAERKDAVAKWRKMLDDGKIIPKKK